VGISGARPLEGISFVCCGGVFFENEQAELKRKEKEADSKG